MVIVVGVLAGFANMSATVLRGDHSLACSLTLLWELARDGGLSVPVMLLDVPTSSRASSHSFPPRYWKVIVKFNAPETAPMGAVSGADSRWGVVRVCLIFWGQIQAIGGGLALCFKPRAWAGYDGHILFPLGFQLLSHGNIAGPTKHRSSTYFDLPPAAWPSKDDCHY